jgi:hypothetical protein
MHIFNFDTASKLAVFATRQAFTPQIFAKFHLKILVSSTTLCYLKTCAPGLNYIYEFANKEKIQFFRLAPAFCDKSIQIYLGKNVELILVHLVDQPIQHHRAKLSLNRVANAAAKS